LSEFQVSCPTRHKIGHFGDFLPSRSLGIVLKKLNLTQQKQITLEQNTLSYTPEKKHKKLSVNKDTKTRPKPKPKTNTQLQELLICVYIIV